MNTNKYWNFFKYSLMVATVVGTAFLAGCSDDDDDDGPRIYNGTVMDMISDTQFRQGSGVTADKALDSLVKYLNKYPDLVALLDGSGPLTLFAPSNTAFINLLATPGFPPRIEQINPAIIKGVLSYHVVGEKLMLADLTPTGSGAGYNSLFPITDPCTGAPTGAFGAIKVNTNGTLLTGSTNQDIDVTSADNEANNGVVHIVESVMIPPTVGSSLTPILGKLSGTVSLASSFSHLATLVRKADCATANAADRIAVVLSSNGPFTAFLPPNPVFEAAAQQAGVTVEQYLNSINAQTARAILLNHVVAGNILTTNMTNGQELTTLGGGKLTITVAGENRLISSGGANNVPIVPSSANLAHSNGTAHAIGGVLLP